MIREEIKNLIENSIQRLQEEKVFPPFSLPSFKVEKPPAVILGDYASNIAILITRIIKKDPLFVGTNINSKILELNNSLFEKIELSKTGFLNFFISPKYLQEKLKDILKKRENCFRLKIGKNEKIQVEFISANPTGPLHIGNGRGAFFGDCLANVLKASGYKVFKEYFINDGKKNSQIQELGKTALGKGSAYMTPYLKEKISEIKRKLKKIKCQKEAGFVLAQEIQKDIKKFIEKKLKIKFDKWVSENELFKKGKVKKVYEVLKRKNLIYKKEKAEWLKISEFGAPKDEVILRKTGEPTYFLSDIAYHKYKFDRGFKKIINIWGADHQGHIPKIKAVAKIFNFKGDLEILISQLVTIKGGKKISKRRGKIILLEGLIDEVGLDVARFFYLTKSLNTPMEFDLKLAKDKSQANPLFYIQYAFARICSVFRKAKIKEQQIKISKKEISLLKEKSEIDLIKELIRLPEIIEDCQKDYQLQRIPRYALDLASAFHCFYEKCRVLEEKKELRKARIALISATKVVLKETLSLMGVSTPEKM